MNALYPIEVTLPGITIDFKERQLLNAYSPIEVTLSGMTVDPQPLSSLLVAVSMIPLQLARESYTGLSGLTIMDSKEEQPSNANILILVTQEGITIDSKEEHP